MDTIHPVNMSHPGHNLPAAEPPLLEEQAPDEAVDVAAGEALREAELRAAEEHNDRDEFTIDQLRAMAEHLGVRNAATTVDRAELVGQIKAALS